MVLSIIITCFNEAKTIKENLNRVEQTILPQNISKEIIIVDDCSTDGSQDILSSLDKTKYKIVFLEKNTGKGGALRRGISEVTGDYAVVQDADLELNPDNLSKLLEPLLANKADMVLGSRFLGKSLVYFNKKYFKYFLANKLITLFFNLFFFVWLTDVNCGYKMFKTPILKQLDITANSFDIEVEILAKLIKKGYHICEVPVDYFPRTTAEGKKIRLKHAFLMLKTIIKNRFN